MRAQAAGRLDHRLIPPLLQRRRCHVGEQAGRQTERGDRRQLLGLGQHRRQADRTRRRLDPPQQIRLLLNAGIIARPGQGQQPGGRLRRQPARDPPGQPPAGLEQRRPHIPFHLIRRRRFQPPDPGTRPGTPPGPAHNAVPAAPRHPPGTPPAWPRPPSRTPGPEVAPDLMAVPLDGPSRPVITRQLRRVGRYRAGHELHRIRMQLAPVAGEAPVPAVETKQQREGEPAVAVLDGHQIGLVLTQSPVLDQLTKAQRSRGSHKRSSSRTSSPGSHMIMNLAAGHTLLTNAPC
jgi:hypothetical protein